MPQDTIDSPPCEASRRRTFAIISHPDAGKTTLTEKLLLYGGAIHLAGTVKARRAARHATSDWMELEKQRGISVTSSVMQFDYEGLRLNLLDTPGHQDFSEDTYRTLIAADSAVMLLDNRKGVEERTRQLFAVCRRRRMPIFTFVNKCDRAGADPLTLLGDVEADLGLVCHAVTWPIMGPHGLAGVYDRWQEQALLVHRSGDHGARIAAVTVLRLDDSALETAIGPAGLARLQEDLVLLDGAGHPFDRDAFLDGALSPVFFGSALTNVGLDPFLHAFRELAPPPRRATFADAPAAGADPFAGFVFKIQANMDPRHRDRVAFLRVVSGHFTAGLEVTHPRSGKRLRLSAPQQFMAGERAGVDEAWPGDVLGVLDRGTLRIGDTVTTGAELVIDPIPRFPPEHFVRVYPADPLRRKHLDAGLRQLAEEGAVHVFYAEGDTGPAPILGAVGKLQFDVITFRLEHEYGAACRLEPLGYGDPRWVRGTAAAIERAAQVRGRLRVYDTRGNPLLLFENEWSRRWAVDNEPALEFSADPP